MERERSIVVNKDYFFFPFHLFFGELWFRFRSHWALAIALQKSDSLAIAVLVKAMGLNGYSTHSLAKKLHAQILLRTSLNGSIDNVQFPFFSHNSNTIANAQCERNLTLVSMEFIFSHELDIIAEMTEKETSSVNTPAKKMQIKNRGTRLLPLKEKISKSISTLLWQQEIQVTSWKMSQTTTTASVPLNAIIIILWRKTRLLRLSRKTIRYVIMTQQRTVVCVNQM